MLIHRNADIDNRRVHELLERDLEDLDTFIAVPLQAFPEPDRA